jgi:hypothetical protein
LRLFERVNADALSAQYVSRYRDPRVGGMHWWREFNELAASGRAKRSPRPAELSGTVVRHTVAELLEAEESTELALQMISKERKRYEIESLLPWHAVGTLSRSDAERVEQALAEDSVLTQRYELVLEELAAAIHLNDTLGSPSERAMEKLFAAIDAEEETHRRPCASLRHRRA